MLFFALLEFKKRDSIVSILLYRDQPIQQYLDTVLPRHWNVTLMQKCVLFLKKKFQQNFMTDYPHAIVSHSKNKPQGVMSHKENRCFYCDVIKHGYL